MPSIRCETISVQCLNTTRPLEGIDIASQQRAIYHELMPYLNGSDGVGHPPLTDQPAARRAIFLRLTISEWFRWRGASASY
jgi:hypothetical protein